MPVLVEACVTSRAEAVDCFRAGAGRVELCRALDVGGLTPAAADVRDTLASSSGLAVMALVRTRSDTFRVGAGELAALVGEVAAVASLGVAGVVVGALDGAGRIDEGALGEMVAAANGLPVTFHRAFDQVVDPVRGIEVLARTGVTRVLTSGGADTAWQGRGMLRTLVRSGPPGLTVLGGGRIRADHVARLVEETGLTEVHARASAVPAVIAALGRPGGPAASPSAGS